MSTALGTLPDVAAEPRVRRGSLRLTSPELLRALMNRWDYSLADVATVAGTHRSAIDHLLHGRSSGLREDCAVRVAAALRVDLETLFVDPTQSVPSSVTWGRGRPRPPEVRRMPDEQAAQPLGGGAGSEPLEAK